MATSGEDYRALCGRVVRVGKLNSIAALLDWDQEVCMPSRGVVPRAELLALIAGEAHEALIADETASLLSRVEVDESVDPAAATIVREFRRRFDRAVKLPTSLVTETAEVSSLAKDSWARARKASDFSLFVPHLGRLVELRRQAAEYIGFEEEPYDALMDEFEAGARASETEALFSELRKATVALLDRLRGAPHVPDVSILGRHYPRPQQEELSRRFAEAIGFDFAAGRGDVSVHPFCTTIGGSSDVRITTRYEEDFFSSAIFGTMHEAGHGLYEQGLSEEHRFTPVADAASLGIHESQSRMWENMVGRSRAFWECHFEDTRGLFPAALGDVTLDSFYGAVNHVSPSMIRVEADELTYNLHIILRFELERSLMSGEIDVGDIPAVWNEKMSSMLGVIPANDSEGCLQDIHWSMGAFGYFPTYAFGNIYAAQFFEKAQSDIPGLFDHIRRNEHGPLLTWLRENIHCHGQRFDPKVLVERVCGSPPSIDSFVRYVTRKFESVYGLS